MFCGPAAKIVGGIGIGCTLCSLIVTYVLPGLILSSAVSDLSDHADGSGITFAPSAAIDVIVNVTNFSQTHQATVNCIHPDRNLGWGIWMANVATLNCSSQYPLIHVTGPASIGVVGVPVDTTNQCQSEPAPNVAAAALVFDPVLRKVASFSPLMTPILPGADNFYGNMTATVGDYTVNCGTVQCWIVDDREVMQATLNTAIGGVTSVLGAAAFFMVGFSMSAIGSLLCCIACCLACCMEEPDERPTKGGRLMDEDSAEDV